MRRIINYSCEGAICAATLDSAALTVGLLIVSGGNEVRIGSHGGMAKLAQEVAAAGFPVFRYDRRGVGDSEGVNQGFQASAPDMRAALEAFRAAQPHLTSVIALGNCDGATALLLTPPAGLSCLMLTNPWVVETQADEPAPAAARAYYALHLRDPRAWFNLLRGRVNLRKTAGSLTSAVTPATNTGLAKRVAEAMEAQPIPTHIILANHDGTAIAFAHQWASDIFDAVRQHVRITRIDTTSHSFAPSADHAQLRDAIINVLKWAVSEG